MEFLDKMTEKYAKNLTKIFTDKDINLLKDYDFAYYFFDTIVCLYFDGADEFNEIVNILNVNEEELLKDSYEFLRLNTVGNGIENDKDFINYLVSPLFKKIISFIDLRIKKDSEKDFDYKGYDLPKYYLISGVGNTCGTFMSFMNKYFGTEIKYANFSTNLHLELYLENPEKEEITENDYRIEYYYNDEFLLSISYVEFKNKIKNYLLNQNDINSFCIAGDKKEDEKDEKEEKEEKEDDSNWYMIGIIIAVIVIIILVIIIIIVLRKRIKSNDITENDGKEKLMKDADRSTVKTKELNNENSE